jgi:hypothetical protein
MQQGIYFHNFSSNPATVIIYFEMKKMQLLPKTFPKFVGFLSALSCCETQNNFNPYAPTEI